MLELAVRSHGMEAELEGDQLVRPRSRPDRDGKLDGLEVEELCRQRIRAQVCGGASGVEEGRIAQRMRLDTQLTIVEGFIRNVAQVDDPLFGERPGLRRGKARQPLHRVFRLHFIAAAICVEAAFERRIAVRTNTHFRLGRLRDHLAGAGYP